MWIFRTTPHQQNLSGTGVTMEKLNDFQHINDYNLM